MKRSVLVAPLAVSLFLFAACRDQQPLQPKGSGGPAFLISDGAHAGNQAFFFLPPLVADPSAFFHAGRFNAALSPVAEVCTLSEDPRLHLPPDPRAAQCVGGPVFGPAPMPLESDQYHLNWDTKASPLIDANFYRMTVRGAPGGTALGFVDLDPVVGGMKNVKTGDVVPFQDGRTLAIKVRIEEGAFGATNADHVEQVVRNIATTVTTNTGFAGAAFPNDWFPVGTPPEINQVVVIIDRVPVNNATRQTSCLNSGLVEKQGCYRFRTDPDLHQFGAFKSLVTTGVCIELHDVLMTHAPYQLYRREEIGDRELVALRSQPAAFLSCETFAPLLPGPALARAFRSGDFFGMASAGFRAFARGLRRVLQPTALHAVDLGAGGSTDGFSSFGWARSATITKDATTDNQTAVTGTKIAKDPTVCLVTIHPTPDPELGPPPLVGEPVTFVAAAGSGSVGGAGSVVVTTGEDGCASAPWVLASTAGTNSLTASAGTLPGSVGFTATGATISASVSDPVDAGVGNPDLTSATVSARAGNLTLTVHFTPGTLTSDDRASFVIDIDRNPATGFAGINSGHGDQALMSTEFLIQMGSPFVGPTVRIFRCNGPSFEILPNSIPITFLTDGMQATIPLALLGDDDGTVNYKVTVQRQLDEGGGFTGILDYMPDLGAAPGMVQLPGPPIL